jgi:hypothetical protein
MTQESTNHEGDRRSEPGTVISSTDNSVVSRREHEQRVVYAVS